MKHKFLDRAIELSLYGIDNNFGGPFGAVIVKNNKIVGEGYNKVTSTNDPTAHAEIVAIRDACKNLNTFDLSDCDLYSSCEPCPMCLSAIYWSNIKKIFYSNTKKQAGNIGFRDDFIYEEFTKPQNKRYIKCEHIPLQRAEDVFKKWITKNKKFEY